MIHWKIKTLASFLETLYFFLIVPSYCSPFYSLFLIISSHPAFNIISRMSYFFSLYAFTRTRLFTQLVNEAYFDARV